MFWKGTITSALIFFCKRYLHDELHFFTFICIWNRVRSVSFPDSGSRDRDIIFRDRTYLVFCFLGFLVKFQVREANKCVYLSANRFSMAWENGIQMPFTFFVFAWHWKTDLNFAFCFSFSLNFEKWIWISFLHCLLLKNRLEFRLSFLHEFEKWINTPVIWNSSLFFFFFCQESNAHIRTRRDTERPFRKLDNSQCLRYNFSRLICLTCNEITHNSVSLL